MRSQDAESVDPAPSWLWDPALQTVAWANTAAITLFPDAIPTDAGDPLSATLPVAALSNACHALLTTAGRSEYGPVTVAGRQVRCRSGLKMLERGGAGVLIELELARPERDAAVAPETATSSADGLDLARIAHDLSTPLTAIVGFAEFVAASGPQMAEQTRRDYLNDIAEAGRFASRMARDLLDFSTVERTASQRQSHADLTEIAQRTARMLALEAEQRGITLTVATGAQAPVAAADPDQILRAFGNLARNAVAHAESAVEISLTTDSSLGAVLNVSNDGPGLSPEDLQLALKPFGRPNRALPDAEQRGGVGLGLPIAQRFAESNGAWLEIETTPDTGFSARLVFPPRLLAPNTD